MERYTKDYLNYIKETKDIDMSEQYKLFMKYVPKSSKILDAGFGSGRDISFFKQYYDVTGIDLSGEFVSYVKENIHTNVYQMDILDLKFDEKFDAIWACASFVHFKLNEFSSALQKIHKILIDGGLVYISLKSNNDKNVFIGNKKIDYGHLHEIIKNRFIFIEKRSSYSINNKQNWHSFIIQSI